MKKLMLILILLVVFTACTSDNTRDDTGGNEMTEAVYTVITAEEAKEMMVEGNIILDVRTQEEYDSGHIEGAILLPLDQIQERNLALIPDKDQVYLIYCRSGNRSAIAGTFLMGEGYTQIYDFGGILDWPYDIVK